MKKNWLAKKIDDDNWDMKVIGFLVITGIIATLIFTMVAIPVKAGDPLLMDWPWSLGVLIATYFIFEIFYIIGIRATKEKTTLKEFFQCNGIIALLAFLDNAWVSPLVKNYKIIFNEITMTIIVFTISYLFLKLCIYKIFVEDIGKRETK